MALIGVELNGSRRVQLAKGWRVVVRDVDATEAEAEEEGLAVR